MERGPVCCGDGGGEVEGMTKQGEVDRLQTPASRPRAQEVIHIRKRLPAPRVHAHGSPRLDDPMKEEPPGPTVLDRTRRPHTANGCIQQSSATMAEQRLCDSD